MAIRIHGRGRRPLPTGEGLAIQKTVRLRPAEFTAIYRAAARDGMRMATWIRLRAAEAARREGDQRRDPPGR